MGQLRKNGIIYGGGNVNALGMFIDTDNEIASGTYSSSSPLSYTATEDCFAYVHVIMDVRNAEVKVYIDGEQVYIGFSNNTDLDTIQDAFTCYLKKGQVLTATTTRTDNASEYKIYGIQTGTENLPEYHKYSTDERIVGEWIDGKAIYEKTFDLGSDLIVAYNSWTTLGITLNADKIIETKATASVGSFQGNILMYSDSGTWKGQSQRNSEGSNVRYLTIRYTKATS